MKRICKKEYIQKCNDFFKSIATLSIEKRLEIYFERYCTFGTETECQISKIVSETGISKAEIENLIGSFLKSEHKGFVTLLSKEIINSVKHIIEMYYAEDYDYVVGLAKRGEKPCGIATIDEEVDFIKSNGLEGDMSDEDIRIVARIALEKIKSIECEIFQNNIANS